MSQKKRTPTGDFLNPLAFAELLDLNRETIYRGIARGDLQAVRVGRSIRLPRTQLESLVIENDRDAHDEG